MKHKIDVDSLTTGQIARVARVSQQTIIRAIDKGHLIGYRLPVSGHRRVLINEVEKWMDSTGIPKDLLHDEYGLGTSKQGEPMPDMQQA